MTKQTLLLAFLLTLRPAFAQSPPPPVVVAVPTPPSNEFNSHLQRIIARSTDSIEPALTKFSLDFSGGTPQELVTAIEKATGKPLNAIIPPDCADAQLPPLKMSNVNVSQLFQALMAASRSAQATRVNPQSNSYQIKNMSYGFRTEGALSDDSIWYFYVDKPVDPPPTQIYKTCRYYLLAPYLENGQTVEDITTAIQTGWKMLGDKETPAISFHKETKLLIAVGEPEKLETIDAVLKALKPGPTPPPVMDPTTGLPVTPPAKPKQ